MERKPLDLGTSVIVPVYNAEKTIEDLIHRLFPVLESLNGRFELILINDGSGDRSWELIRKFAEQHPWIRGFNLMRNYGQHNALLCGIRSAKYAIAVTLDDDLQNPPEEIPKLLHKLAEGFDLVYGVPLKEQHGLWRNLASRITKIALRTATGVPSTANVSAYRAFHTRVRDAFDHYQSPFLSLDVLITWGTVRIGAVDVIHEPRGKGDTNYTFRMLIIHALNMITGFSILPLQLASIIGFGFNSSACSFFST